MDNPPLSVPEDLDQAQLARFIRYLAAQGGLLRNKEGRAVPRTQVADLLDLVIPFERAWQGHPDYYVTFPPAAMSVW